MPQKVRREDGTLILRVVRSGFNLFLQPSIILIDAVASGGQLTPPFLRPYQPSFGVLASASIAWRTAVVAPASRS